MKINIYELLGMIKDGNIPQRIIFKGRIFEYVESAGDYYNEEHGYISDVYVLKSILDDEVTILETTINTKNMNINTLDNQNYFVINDRTPKIERIDKIEYLRDIYKDDRYGYSIDVGAIKDKINEIIDKLNKE